MSRQKIFVLGRSEPWCSAIKRSLVDEKLSWVLDLENLIHESADSFGATAIIEILTDDLQNTCRELTPLINNSLQLKLFALGEPSLNRWKPLLNASGFAATFCGFLELPALIRAVRKHPWSAISIPKSIETRVWADLPWPTAATDRQA